MMVIALEPGSPSTVKWAIVAPSIVAPSAAPAIQVVRGMRKRAPPPTSTTPVKYRNQSPSPMRWKIPTHWDVALSENFSNPVQTKKAATAIRRLHTITTSSGPASEGIRLTCASPFRFTSSLHHRVWARDRG